MRTTRLWKQTLAAAIAALLPLSSLPANALPKKGSKNLKTQSMRTLPMRHLNLKTPTKPGSVPVVTPAAPGVNELVTEIQAEIKEPAAATAGETLKTADQMMADKDQAPNAGTKVYDQAKPQSGDVSAAPVSAQVPAADATGVSKLEQSTGKAGPLPRVVEPTLYKLSAKLYPDEKRYETSGKIQLKMTERRASVTLHAADMEITKVIFKGAADRAERIIDPKSLIWDEKNERVTVPIGTSYKGKAELYFEIKAKLNEQGAGVYLTRDEYKGKVENYIGTQFEATDARRFFPMIDEPGYKPQFDLTLETPAWHTVRANMPSKKETIVGDRKITEFERSPKMASYLLAFVSGRFESISLTTKSGVNISVWGHPDQVKKQGKLALEAAEKILGWGEQYFGQPYPLPKLDLIALADFASGAMENWGMITFRKEALFYDPKASAAAAKERVLQVVSHELAHMWFGDLVTMKWWNGLWLNEAFANYMENKGVDAHYPKIGIWKSVELGKQDAMKVDALVETRGVHTQVKTEAEIDSIFDSITYEKGGAILKMLDHYLTLPVFQKGVQLYMERHKYKNAELEDLWKALAEASGDQRVFDIGMKWVTQKGFPRVAVVLTGGMTLDLYQQRFMANGQSDAENLLWPIPMVFTYQIKGEKEPRTHRIIFDKRTDEVTLPGQGELLWVNPNGGQTGFYRSALTPLLSDMLLENGLKQMTAVERVGILKDLWMRAQTGAISIDRYLDALTKFAGEKDRIVLGIMAESLATIHNELLKTENDRLAFARLVQTLMGSQWKAWGWEKQRETADQKRSRGIVLAVLGRYTDNPTLAKQAQSRVKKFLKDPSSIDPNIALPMMEIAAKTGGKALFDQFLAAYKTSKVADQKNRYLAALTMFQDPALVQEALSLAFAKDKDASGSDYDVIRGQDVFRLFVLMLQGDKTRQAAYDTIVANWPAIRKKTGPKGADRIIQSLGTVRDAHMLAHMKSFFPVGENREPRADRSFKQSVELAENGITFMRAQRSTSDWLRTWNNKNPAR